MTKLVDHLGRPVSVSELDKDVATVAVGTVRSPWFDSVASSLTPERLGSLLVKVDQGDLIDYVTLAEEMEERDLHYSSVLRTRKLAVSGLPIVVEAATDDKRDIEISDFVREMMSSVAVSDLMSDLLDALGKGFSVSEIMWDRGTDRWRPREYIWRDPRYFVFDRETMDVIRLRDEKDLVNGVELIPYKFVVHRPRLKTGLTIRGGLARLAAVAYMCKSYNLKDWLSFVEVFGLPLRVGRYPVGATAQQKATLLSAVTRIGTDAACIIPDGMMIEFVSHSQGSEAGDKVFHGMADWLDSQVSKGVLGQTMTTDNGSSLAQAKVHADVRRDIVVDDAAKLSATLQRDLVRPLVDLNFGPPSSGVYPHVRLAVEVPEDLESLAKSLPPFIELGLRVEESVIRDKFGLPEPADGASLLGGLKSDEVRSSAGVCCGVQYHVGGQPVDEDALERALLRAIEQAATRDSITALVDDELRDWERIAGPMLQPILDLIERSTGYTEFIEGLDTALAAVDTSELLRSLALQLFVARGLGNTKDRV